MALQPLFNLPAAFSASWTGVQTVAMPLPTQGNTKRVYTHTEVHASVGIRTHNLSVWADKRVPVLDRAATVIDTSPHQIREITKTGVREQSTQNRASHVM
jgi:hypothetical protein